MITEGYLGIPVPDDVREHLISLFPPRYPQFKGEHITVQYPFLPTGFIEGSQHIIDVIGYAHEEGLEALVCRVDGSLKRSDGSTYHITWSLDPTIKKPVDSNTLIKTKGFEPTPNKMFTFNAALKFFD